MGWQSLYLQAAASHGSGGAEGKLRLIPIPQPSSDRKHVCPTCGIAFPTHYALGGHTKSHRDRDVNRFFGQKILRGRFSAAHAFGSIMAQQHQRQGGAVVPGAAIGLSLGGIWNIPPPLPEARDSMRHSCSRCSLVFSSGKALDGHMRTHLQAEREHMEAVAAVAEESAVAAAVAEESVAAAAVAEASSVTEAAAARATVHRLDIDLNKPAPME